MFWVVQADAWHRHTTECQIYKITARAGQWLFEGELFLNPLLCSSGQMKRTIGMICVSCFLLSKMNKREIFMFSSPWSSSRKFQPVDKKNKGNAAWSFSFSKNKYTGHEISHISHPHSHALQVKGIFFFLDDILRTGCQSHLSPHLQLSCLHELSTCCSIFC